MSVYYANADAQVFSDVVWRPVKQEKAEKVCTEVDRETSSFVGYWGPF